jgi:MFS family permease
MPPRVSEKFLLVVIVFAQFAGTSLWFSGNAILSDIKSSGALSNITSIVQFGFIAGTLIFSLGGIADRYSAPRVFLFSSIIAAVANALLIWTAHDMTLLYTFRFITGFFLAGIYPVGMKIAADCFPGKLGNALGFLVGALVLGTAFPNIMKTELKSFMWEDVLLFTSALAVIGGILIALFTPRTQHESRKKFSLSSAFSDFRITNFRAAAFGYFGHMWELYALWAFIPQLIRIYNQQNFAIIDVSLWTFIIIGSGSVGCVIGGILSKHIGSKRVALYAMILSALCCLTVPIFIRSSEFIFLGIMVLWGISVVADSPQFSTLVATSAGFAHKGTALTIVTCIGFSITIISIQVMKPVLDATGTYASLILLPGPVLGMIALEKYLPVINRQVSSSGN